MRLMSVEGSYVRVDEGRLGVICWGRWHDECFEGCEWVVLSFSKVPRSNQCMKLCVNTSTEVAEYSHRSVESIWRRNEPKTHCPSGANCSRIAHWFGQFRVSF